MKVVNDSIMDTALPCLPSEIRKVKIHCMYKGSLTRIYGIVHYVYKALHGYKIVHIH